MGERIDHLVNSQGAHLLAHLEGLDSMLGAECVVGLKAVLGKIFLIRGGLRLTRGRRLASPVED